MNLINSSGGRKPLCVLSHREQSILAGIYYDQLTQEVLAKQFKVSQPRISQIIAQAEAKLESAGIPLPHKHRDGRTFSFSDGQLDRLRPKAGGSYTWNDGEH